MHKRFLGVFVNALYAQIEGVAQVLDNIEAVGARAICLSPRVAWLSESATRFPDLHVDGHERLVARPVWGLGEARIETTDAYQPDVSLYGAGPYAPGIKPVPSCVDATIPDRLIEDAKRRGMQVHLMFHPLLPPGVRVEDRPTYIDDSRAAPPLVAQNACPNAPAAQTYGLALVQDIAQRYRDVDGLIPDWVEFGAYRFSDHFACFCPHCRRAAKARGFDWEAMRRDVAALWGWCHSLSANELERSRRLLRNPSELLCLLTHYPGFLQFLRFKAETISGFYQKIRQRLIDLGLEKLQVTARGWPPPWNRSSGMDYQRLSTVCDVVAPKLFTFDYSALPRWYGETLLSWNPGLSESETLDALVDWMSLPDDIESRSFADYHIPAPGEPHPARIGAYRPRLDEVVAQAAGGQALCYPIAHAYLPEPQWKRMLAVIRDSRVDGLWVHMYGYLSDRKLEILKQIWR